MSSFLSDMAPRRSGPSGSCLSIMAYWVTKSRSISAGSIRSKKGRAEMSLDAGWMPQSSCRQNSLP